MASAERPTDFSGEYSRSLADPLDPATPWECQDLFDRTTQLLGVGPGSMSSGSGTVSAAESNVGRLPAIEVNTVRGMLQANREGWVTNLSARDILSEWGDTEEEPGQGFRIVKGVEVAVEQWPDDDGWRGLQRSRVWSETCDPTDGDWKPITLQEGGVWVPELSGKDKVWTPILLGADGPDWVASRLSHGVYEKLRLGLEMAGSIDR